MYDSIIIGSGIGGLTCGNLLAKNGMKTLILEQHFHPGGYVTSYKRREFMFDVTNIIGSLKKGAPIERIFSYLGLDKRVEFVAIEKAFRFLYPGRTIECYSDIEKYKEELNKHFPREKNGIDRYFKTVVRIWDEIMHCYNDPNLFQFLTYPARFPNLVKYRNKTHEALLDAFLQDEELKEIMGAAWLFVGLPSSQASAIYTIGVYMSYHAGGAWYPKGGYQAMSDAFATNFEEFGGELRLKTKVERIIIEKNKAIGVELASGEVIRATNIISNADAKLTFLKLIEDGKLNTKYSDKIKNLVPSSSGLVVHLGVKMDIPSELHCGFNILSPGYGSTSHMFKMAAKNMMETNASKIMFALCVPSMRNPDAAPKGHHTIDISYMPAPYHFNNTWMQRDKRKYNVLKEEMGNVLISAAEQIIPELSKHIVVKDVSTPLTNERYTLNEQGGWYAQAHTPDQTSMNRLRQKTPIKNLYLTGSKAFPGAGVYGAMQSGLYTADALLGNILTKGKYAMVESIRGE